MDSLADNLQCLVVENASADENSVQSATSNDADVFENDDDLDDNAPKPRCISPLPETSWIDLSDKHEHPPTPKRYVRGQCVKVKQNSLAERDMQGKHGRILRELPQNRHDVWFDHLQAAQPIYTKHLQAIRRRDYHGSFNDPIRSVPDLRRPSSSARTDYERFQLVVLCDFQDCENCTYNGQCAVVEHLFNPTSKRIGLQLLSRPGSIFAVEPRHIRRPYETEYAPLVDHVASICHLCLVLHLPVDDTL